MRAAISSSEKPESVSRKAEGSLAGEGRTQRKQHAEMGEDCMESLHTGFFHTCLEGNAEEQKRHLGNPKLRLIEKVLCAFAHRKVSCKRSSHSIMRERNMREF